MTVNVKKVLNSIYATNSSDGKLLFRTLKKAPSLESLVVSFKGIDLLSSAFLNASIGKLALLHPSEIQKVKFSYPEDDYMFQAKVKEVIENALLGEKYDQMHDEAVSG